jgi:geranylgeranyl diphosphate synthase, type I
MCAGQLAALTNALAPSRSAGQILEEARARVEPAYRALVEALPGQLRHIAGYHAGWWDVHGHPCSNAGKAVRPALVLACSGGAWQRAVDAAVAVEMVHDFSLLHDDIMDRDLTRRHRPAAWAVFGIGPAMLAGDALLTLATSVVGPGPGTEVLTQVLLELCAGQCEDLAFEQRTDVTVAQALAMAESKTGTLLGGACQLGALAAGADAPDALRYRGFGRELGVAFQLVDDLLGIWGDPAVTGKPVHADLTARKKSLPVVAALTSGTVAGEQLKWLYHRDQALDGDDLADFQALIEQAGGRAWASAEAERRLQTALGHLATAALSPQALADLETLAALITRRER